MQYAPTFSHYTYNPRHGQKERKQRTAPVRLYSIKHPPQPKPKGKPHRKEKSRVSIIQPQTPPNTIKPKSTSCKNAGQSTSPPPPPHHSHPSSSAPATPSSSPADSTSSAQPQPPSSPSSPPAPSTTHP